MVSGACRRVLRGSACRVQRKAVDDARLSTGFARVLRICRRSGLWLGCSVRAAVRCGEKRDRSTSSRFRSALLAGSGGVVGSTVRQIEEATMRFASYVTRVDRIALAIGFRSSGAQDSAPAEPPEGALGSCPPVGSLRQVTNHLTSPTLSPSWMCATASSAATTFAARTGQPMRDIGRLHNATGLALEVLTGGRSHSTLHSLGDPRSQFCGRNDRVDGTHPQGAFYGVHRFELRCHFTELVGTYRRPRGGELQP